MYIELLYSAVQWFYSAWQRLSCLSLPPYFSRFAASPDQPHVFFTSSLFLWASSVSFFTRQDACPLILLSLPLFFPVFSSQESVNMRKFYSGVIFYNLKFVRRYNDNKIRVHLDLIGCFCGGFLPDPRHFLGKRKFKFVEYKTQNLTNQGRSIIYF